MNHRNFTLTLTLFAGIFLALIAFTSSPTDAAASDDFSVSLSISNVGPSVNYVDGTISFTPLSNSTDTAYLYFNATDSNGATDLDTATAQVTISLNGVSTTSSSCSVLDTDGNERSYNCSIDIPYYYEASTSWEINASIDDSSGSSAFNNSQTLTINELKSISLDHASLGFSGNPGDSDILASEGAQRLHNLGNYNFTELNTTGYDLEGSGTSSIIGAGNFSVNVTNSATGTSLDNATAVAIPDFVLEYGASENQTLYVYLDIPATAEADTYNSQGNWTLDVD